MAGNIIPAIATTNAIIAGLIVMEAFKVLTGNLDQCKTIFLNRVPNNRKKLLAPCQLEKPNPKCYVCSSKPEVTLALNTEKITVKTLEDKVMKGQLGMVAPDVEIDDGKGTIMISSEEGETEGNAEKFLTEFGISNGSRLKVDDFLQSYNIVINIAHVEKLADEKEFEIAGDLSELAAKQGEKEPPKEEENSADKNKSESDIVIEDDDDDMIMMEDEDDVAMETESRGTKRKASDEDMPSKIKKNKPSLEGGDCVEITSV